MGRPESHAAEANNSNFGGASAISGGGQTWEKWSMRLSRSKFRGLRRVVSSTFALDARSKSRITRHLLAAVASFCVLGAVAATASTLSPARHAFATLNNGIPWPWMVFGLPVLFSFPVAVVFEWLGATLRLPPWVAPLVLVPILALVWAFARGLDGQFEGVVSVIKALPIAFFGAAAFTTYWLPLRLIRLHLRKSRRRPA
jgi:hypothetical protein